MKHLGSICFAIAVGLLLTGCGHSVIRTDRGTGLVAAIPLPSGSSLIELKLGNIDSTTAVLRGGAVYNADNAKGGTFGTVSTGDHIQVVTQPAINEGYAQKVLNDPHVGDAVKIELVKYFASQKVQLASPAAARAVNATAGTGEKPPNVDPVKTGIDNAVDKVTEMAPEVVKPVAQTITDTTGNVKETAANITRDAKSIVLYLIIGIVVLAICVLIVMYFWIKWKKKQEKKADSTATAKTASTFQEASASTKVADQVQVQPQENIQSTSQDKSEVGVQPAEEVKVEGTQTGINLEVVVPESKVETPAEPVAEAKEVIPAEEAKVETETPVETAKAPVEGKEW